MSGRLAEANCSSLPTGTTSLGFAREAHRLARPTPGSPTNRVTRSRVWTTASRSSSSSRLIQEAIVAAVTSIARAICSSDPSAGCLQFKDRHPFNRRIVRPALRRDLRYTGISDADFLT